MTARAHYIRASEVASALALDKRKSRLALFLEKQGKMLPDDSDNAALEEGREFEDAIARIAARRYSLSVTPAPSELVSDEDCLIGHPDRLAHDPDTETDYAPAILEIKHTFSHQDVDQGEWGPPLSDKVPTPYWVQTAVYQHLLGKCQDGPPHAWLAARLHSGTKLYRIQPAQDTMVRILAEVAEFVRRIELDDPPQPQDEAEMRLRWMAQRDKLHTANPELIAWIRAYRDTGEQEAALKKQRSDLKTLILGSIQDAGQVVAPHPSTGALIPILGASGDRVFSEPAFVAAHPDLAAKYQTLDTTRLRKEQPQVYESFMHEPTEIGQQRRTLRVLRDLKAFDGEVK